MVHPPVSVSRDYIDYPYFADLGAVQNAAVLRELEGIDVELVDSYALGTSTLAWREDGRAHLGASVAEVLELTAGPADLVVVGYTPFHRPPHRDDVLAELLVGLRGQHAEATILLADLYQSGQHYVEATPAEVLSAYPEVDAWLKYEAETTLPELVRGLADGDEKPRGGLLGVAPPNLDELPWPAWDAIDLDAYHRFHARVVRNLGRGQWAFPIDGRTLPLVTSRGCPFTCVHCSSNPGRPEGAPKTQRRYSSERLVAYLEHLAGLGASRLEVMDELINVNERHFDGFLETVERLDLRFDVPNGYRADYLEPRHFARMAGRVATVSVSAESGNQRVVSEVVTKKLDLACIRAAAENAQEAGVPLLIHYIIGFPGETAEEVNDTLALALELWDEHKAWPAVQYATPLPGTPLAAGRSLPVVHDWGPYFQKAPSHPDASVDAETLQKFMRTFEQRLRESQGPQKLIMNVTYVCNNHCTFCAVGTRTQVDGHPTRQREFLDKYRDHGVTMVDFDGGEPTLNPKLIPLIRYARHVGYERVNVTTNGRLCAYEDFAKKLVQSGLTTLLFSVHGPDLRTHAAQVGVAEAWGQTIKGIEYCVAHKPETVELGMNITLTKGNYKKLEQVTQLAWDFGLPWLNIQFLTPFGRATKEWTPDTQEAADITMGVIDRWKDRMKLQVINLPYCFMPGYEEYLAGDMQKLGRHMIFVNNDTVNLGDYLAERRHKTDECKGCPHGCFCGGFYDVEDVPEPEWVVSAESLVRKVDPEMQVR